MEFKTDPLLSFIVPIYDIKPEVLKRCLMSLEDQDYPNIEVVCVLDGPNVELVNVVCDFLRKNHTWKVIEIEHAGACAARNAGFNSSSGEIVSFFNSDYIAKAGMARMWVSELQKHPDCGFVYGGYEYLSVKRAAYPSKPFDPFQLEIANYIDCGFPLWRKYVVEWDVNCKSLQDWDFWLRVVKTHNVKGYYMERDLSFLAEPPRPKGLSYDSSENWTSRVHYIKDKNGIPEREICVTSLGARNHAVEIAKMLGADFRDDTIFKPHNYRGLYLIGWYMKPTDQGNQHPQIMMHFDKLPKIIHFVGADIYWLRKFPYESLKALAGAIQLKSTAILCETEWAQAELFDLGIKAKVVPIPSYSDFQVKPLPEEFTVSVFLTDYSDFDKYCYENTLSIIRAMPDVNFTAYGDAGWEVDYPNLKHSKNMPRPEWEKYVYANSCYLRLVRHDTLPMASCEFVLAGRDVITNVPQPFTETIDTSGTDLISLWDKFGPGLNTYRWPDTKSDIIRRIRAVKNKQAGNMGLEHRIEAADYYAKMLDKDLYRQRIRAILLPEKETDNADIGLETAAEPSDRQAVGSARG